MQCEIISIGDEVLIGQVINTNASWLGRELTGMGLEIRKVTAVSDQKEAIIEALRQGMDHARWIFVTGGLGPTKDDRTKDALLGVFGGELVFHEETWQNLIKIFALYNRTPMDSHRQQCFLPSTARVLPNRMGTAPGLLFETSHNIVCVMPGVPYEMEHIMQTQMMPIITETLAGEHTIIHQTICTVGEGESVLADRIADIEDSLPPHMRLAYLPAPGRVRIRVTGSGQDHAFVSSSVAQISSSIVSRIKEFVYAMEDISLAEAIGKQLRASGKTLSVAESCTGGFLSHLITSISGSSEYFLGGVVSYSNQLKQSILGVKAQTLEAHGAVSEETVCEMANGARLKFHTDYAIAITGIAGPVGGTTDKPVGTVWMAVADAQGIVSLKRTFGKDRLRNIELSAVYALDMLRKKIG